MSVAPDVYLELTDEQLAIEAELVERELCFRRLLPFTSRATPNFKAGWHLEEIAAAVEAVEMGIQAERDVGPRLILEAPPRHGKSQIISRCTPLWYLGRHPDHEVIVATYSQELADDLGRWAKQALTDPAIRAVFPDLEIRKDSRAANRMGTTKGGIIHYVGAGGPITGRGAHLAIIDDPIKGSEDADSETQSNALWDWYNSVLRTRLAPSGGIIVLHTRWRINDLIGRLIEAQRLGEGEEWIRKTFQALAGKDDPWGRKEGEALHPARYNEVALAQLRKALPSRDWMALYQQSPTLDEGNIFKVKDFNLYSPGSAPSNLYWHISTDLGASAKKSADPTCIWPFGVDENGGIWWSPDFVYDRLTTEQSTDRILRFAEEYNAQSIIIEGGPIWKSIEPFFMREKRERRLFQTRIINPPPVSDKYHRSRTSHGMMSSGYMRFADTARLRHEVMPQFLLFTGVNDPHDDLVDTVSWAGLISKDLVWPCPGEAVVEDDEEVVPGSYQDILRRIPADDGNQKRRHSPMRFHGGERRKGAEYRYA